MPNLLRVELFKWTRSRVFWALIATIIILLFLLLLTTFLAENESLKEIEGFEVTVDTAGEELNGALMFVGSVQAPSVFITVLMISVLAAFLLSGEYATGVIKNLVSIGYNRSQIYMAKLAVFSLGSIILVLLIPVMIGIYGSLFFGMGDWPNSEDFVSIGKYLLLTWLFVISIVSITILFAMALNSRGMTLMFAFGFYLLIDKGIGFLAHHFELFETAQKYSIYYRLSEFPETKLDASTITELVSISLVTSFIFMIIGMMVFRRKDIQ